MGLAVEARVEVSGPGHGTCSDSIDSGRSNGVLAEERLVVSSVKAISALTECAFGLDVLLAPGLLGRRSRRDPVLCCWGEILTMVASTMPAAARSARTRKEAQEAQEALSQGG